MLMLKSHEAFLKSHGKRSGNSWVCLTTGVLLTIRVIARVVRNNHRDDQLYDVVHVGCLECNPCFRFPRELAPVNASELCFINLNAGELCR